MELAVPQPPKITLWHHPSCSKSRRARELLALTDCEVELYDYQADPPSPQQLQELLGWLKRRPHEVARKKEAAWAELVEEKGLDERDDEAVLAALCRQPGLIERPIAAAAEHAEAIVGRPPELVLQLLVPKPPEGFDAEQMLRMAMQGKLPK